MPDKIKIAIIKFLNVSTINNVVFKLNSISATSLERYFSAAPDSLRVIQEILPLTETDTYKDLILEIESIYNLPPVETDQFWETHNKSLFILVTCLAEPMLNLYRMYYEKEKIFPRTNILKDLFQMTHIEIKDYFLAHFERSRDLRALNLYDDSLFISFKEMTPRGKTLLLQIAAKLNRDYQQKLESTTDLHEIDGIKMAYTYTLYDLLIQPFLYAEEEQKDMSIL